MPEMADHHPDHLGRFGTLHGRQAGAAQLADLSARQFRQSLEQASSRPGRIEQGAAQVVDHFRVGRQHLGHYRLVDAAGNDLPFDGVSQGEVLLRGPWIIESYAKLADGTDRFLDGYWRSGDAGAIDKHGYLKITDRIKDVIKSGGEWISSVDMENAITSHPRIREAAVIGVEHPTWQERPVVIAVTDDGTEVPLAEIHALLPAFAKWQLPDTVVYVDAIPRTSVGKIDQKALRAAHADTYRATA